MPKWCLICAKVVTKWYPSGAYVVSKLCPQGAQEVPGKAASARGLGCPSSSKSQRLLNLCISVFGSRWHTKESHFCAVSKIS